MKAFVLAGGLGTRLRPLTYTRPKHLLPIANRPHVEHVFDLLLGHGIDHVVMLTSYLSEAFKPVFERAAERGLQIDVTLESEPLGTAGAFKNAERFVDGERFLAFNGDVLTDADLAAIVERHESDRAEATIVLTPVEDPSAFGVVPTDEYGRVQGFIEKPPKDEAPTNLINAGIYVFEPSILERIPANEVWSAERQLFPQLVEEGAPLYAHRSDAYWMDVGTPQKYLQANLDALVGRYRSDATAEVRDGSLIDPSSELGDGASIRASCIGERARIGRAARVEESVLLPGVTVGAGAHITRSILGSGVGVGAGSLVTEQTVADDTSI